MKGHINNCVSRHWRCSGNNMNFVRSVQRMTLANLTLLVSVLLVILPQVPRLPVWLSLLCLAAIGWRLLHDMGKLPLPNRLARMALVILSILGLFVSYHTIVGREAGSALLILMLSLKLLEMQARRDVSVVIFLSFFVVIIGFLFSQSIFIALYMFLVVTMLIASLICFQHLRQDVGLLDFKRNFLHAGRLVLQALPVALLLFVLFPRIPGPLWGLPEDAASAKTGLSDEMQPGRISQLVNSNAVAFRVRFENRVPPPAKRYWRGPVLWDYDGRKWSANRKKTRLRRQFTFDTDGEPLDYQVTLEPHNRHWLFALDLPARLPENTRLTSEFQIISRKPVSEVYRYAIRSYTDYRLDANRPLDLNRYLTVPETAAGRTRKLVQELRQSDEAPTEFVNRVLHYFANQPFYYSRQAPLLFDDPVDEFLFETRKGFCEHYASAFTVMMRLAGIPARVVTGYYGGEMNPLSDYMIVRQSDAHAWSEVWLKQHGWVRVDPTAVIPASRIELTADLIQRRPQARNTLVLDQNWLQTSLRQAGYIWDAINNRWNQWVIGYNQAKQNALFSALGIENITWRGLASMLLVSITAVVTVLALMLFMRPVRHTSQVIRLYQRLLRKLARSGLHKLPYETPSRFSQRISRQRSDLAVPIITITQHYLLLRYANLDQLEQVRLLNEFRRMLRHITL